jgi:hypothetical protein
LTWYGTKVPDATMDLKQVPDGYKSKLALRETFAGIKFIKDVFEVSALHNNYKQDLHHLHAP